MPYWLQYDVFGTFGLLFGQIIFCENRQDHAKKICLSNATSRHCKIFRNKSARAKMRRRGEILETKTTVVDDRRAFVRLSAGNKLI